MSKNNDRKSAIAAAASKKKGSLEERLDNATAPGIIKPSKPAPVKIPSALNLTKPKQEPRVEDAVVQTEGTMKEFVAGVEAADAKKAKRAAPAKAPVVEAPVAAMKDGDKELDASVAKASVAKKEKATKPAKDPNFLSVSDIARELGIDPKRARARLRASGKAAADGRWPLVARGSEEHVAMSGIIKGDDKPVEAKDIVPSPAKVDEDNEE